MNIREFVSADTRAIVALAREIQVAKAVYFDRKKPPDEIGDWYVEGLLESCRLNAGKLLVATRDDDICGYASILTMVANDDAPDEIDYTYAYVQDLGVSESFRGSGIGSQLLEACEQVARRAGARWLRLDVLSDNTQAVKFYEKHALRPVYVSMEKALDEQ